MVLRKINEESYELITTKTDKEIIWETADLLYFMMVLLAKKGISLKEIEREIERRKQKLYKKQK